jgi:hypothetical protein
MTCQAGNSRLTFAGGAFMLPFQDDPAEPPPNRLPHRTGFVHAKHTFTIQGGRDENVHSSL